MFPTPDTPDARPKPMPAVLSESLGADRGLICGFRLRPNAAPQEIPTEEVAPALLQAQAGADAVVWLHFNLSDARARRWLLDATFLPAELRELWREHDGNRRVELLDDGGLPGLYGGAFWWVMSLILASGAVTLAAFFWRRLL